MRSSANASPSGNTMKSSRPTSISIIQRNGIIAALVVAIAWLVFKTQQSVPEYSKAYATGSTVTSPFYDFAVNDIEHRPYDLNQLRGKVLLVVNVASQCGFTQQYKGLEALNRKFQARGLVVLGFPTNDFGAQEPGSEEEIKSFCQNTFGVTFPLFEKLVVSGVDTHPLFAWLTAQRPNWMLERVKWNFEKWLLSRDGWVVERYASTTAPEALERTIESLLAEGEK